MSKAWIEMVHRYLAATVGALILGAMALAWQQKIKNKLIAFSPWFPTALFFLVCVQGAFGAWTVTMKLQPIIVTLHLALALSLLSGLVWHAVTLNAQLWTLFTRDYTSQKISKFPDNSLRILAVLSCIVLVMQILLGGWVSTNYAITACMDYPLCQGKLIPRMDFSSAYTLWRPLGQNADGSYLTLQALAAIHWLHRWFAVVVVAVLGFFAVSLLRFGQQQVINIRVNRLALGLLLALGCQFITGVLNVVLSWPLLTALLHTAIASLMLMMLVVLNFALLKHKTKTKV